MPFEFAVSASQAVCAYGTDPAKELVCTYSQRLVNDARESQ